MNVGIMLGDHPTSVSAAEHFDGILRQVEAAQQAGITYLLIGQHFLFPGGSRWLQPVPTLARLAGEVLADEPLQERAGRLFVHTLTAQGDRATARRALANLLAQLDEHGMAAEPDTTQLARQHGLAE